MGEKLLEGSGNMGTHRLCNTSYTEFAVNLPLPHLPISFGANSRELRLVEEGDGVSRVRTTKSSKILSEAGKIAELLKATDVSYLCLRDVMKNEAALFSRNPANLLAAVLKHDPEAFKISSSGPNKQRDYQISRSDRGCPQNEHGSIALQNNHPGPVANSPQQVSMDARTLVSASKSRIRKKDTNQGRIDEGSFSSGNLEHDTVVANLCEVLEKLFDEMPSEEDGEEGGTLVPFSSIKHLSEELMAEDSKNTLHLVPVGHIVKLLDVLNRNILQAVNRTVNDEDDVESNNYLSIMSALEAAQLSLTVMTQPNMPKQVYKEEFIDKIIEFTRHQIVQSVFTAYDPSYRIIHRGCGMEDDIGNEEENDETDNKPGKKGRRKSKGWNFKRAATAKVSTVVSNVLYKLCSMLGSLKNLLSIERLSDSSVLQLIKTTLAMFVVENIQLLQLKAIGVACAVFSSYSEHRTLILDEIIELIGKLAPSKRNVRAYHLPDEEQKPIQMITALVLQLVQCSVTFQEPTEATLIVSAKCNTIDGDYNPSKCFEPATECCRHFCGRILQLLAAPKSRDISDIKVIIENVIVDLLTTLNVPEYPAASLLLQVLCVLLFGDSGLKSKDMVVRGIAIDLLGQIAARLKHDSVACSNDKHWILQELNEEEAEFSAPQKEMCVVCLGGRGSKFMVVCDGCQQWFHGDCVGVSGHDLVCRGWVCCYCLCRRQLISLDSHLRIQGQKDREGSLSIKSNGPSTPITGVHVIQQILLNYLQGVGSTDNSAAYASQFYLCQWYKDDPSPSQLLLFYHGRLNLKAHRTDFGIASAVLSRNVITRISAALGQQRSLARGFDKILDRLLACLQENSPMPRARALRAVSAIVEVDPGVLGDTRVKCAVEGRFHDSAISVREAAMELVGRHIVSRPDVATKYFQKVAERIMDKGVSVRKRVIKIIRDMCISKCEFGKTTDACYHIISRIDDEETSIQDLVCKTFYELWFEEPSNPQAEFFGDGSIVPLEIAERTQQLVNVLAMLNNHQPLVTIIKRTLALDFCPRNTGTSAVSQAAVRNRCELMCKCLLESILKVEETNSSESEFRALPYVLALHAFCTVDPTLCTPASDPSRFVITLQPYLKTQVDNRAVAQLLQSIAFVIDAVLPLIRRPPPNFVEELERDLRQLIVRYPFLSVVHACIKCLCSLCRVATKGATSFEFLLSKFLKYLDSGRMVQFQSSDQVHVLRCLYCLGLLVRYGAELIDRLNKGDTNIEEILSLYKHYYSRDDIVVKARSLQALGFFCIAKPQYMMDKDIRKILEASLSSDADTRIKVQVLRTFYDYLVDVEEQMGVKDIGSDIKSRKQNDAVPVSAGEGDSNISGGIIQLHWQSILEKCLDKNDQVRQSSLKIVEIVLRQGLVHPVTCVPYLIASEVDEQEMNSKISHSLLMQMNEKYPSFFESRIGDGIELSFRFIQSGASGTVLGKLSGDVNSNHDLSTGTTAKIGISRVYSLIQRSRVSRNKFLSSFIHKFDSGTLENSSLPFLVYCTEVLAALPFAVPDEPLYLVQTINRTVQPRAGILEASMKNLIYDGPLGAIIKCGLEAVEADIQEIEGANIESVKLQANGDFKSLGDMNRIPVDYLQKLKAECHVAVALSLLLRLKRHIKFTFSLNDARCQAFSPTEPIKSGDVLLRQNVPFIIKDIHTTAPRTVHQLLQQYEVLKRLLKEDTMDYNYSASTPRKRTRSFAAQEDKNRGNIQPNVLLSTRSLRKKSLFTPPKVTEDETSESDYEDDHNQRKRRQRSSNGVLLKRKRKIL